MIEIDRLTKKYGDKVIFKDFSLKIETGEYVVFEGKSGRGKTTLLNMIGGIEPFDQGDIVVDGFSLSGRKNFLDYYRNKVSFLFQNFVLIENRTVFENLLLVRKKGVNKNIIINELEKFGLQRTIDQKVYTLSGGEQQRIALIRIILQDNPIILADEPTGSLDDESGAFVLDVLDKLNKKGKTIILVTHDRFVKSRGNRIVSI